MSINIDFSVCKFADSDNSDRLNSTHKIGVSEFQYSSLTAKKIFNAQTAHDKIKSIEFQFLKKTYHG